MTLSILRAGDVARHVRYGYGLICQNEPDGSLYVVYHDAESTPSDVSSLDLDGWTHVASPTRRTVEAYPFDPDSPSLSLIIVTQAGDHLDDQLAALETQIDAPNDLEVVIVYGAGAQPATHPRAVKAVTLVRSETTAFPVLANAAAQVARGRGLAVVSANDIMAPWFVQLASETLCTADLARGVCLDISAHRAQNDFPQTAHGHPDEHTFAVRRDPYLMRGGLDWTGLGGLSKRVIGQRLDMVDVPQMAVARCR